MSTCKEKELRMLSKEKIRELYLGNFVVNDYVYEPYTPQSPGKVLEVYEKKDEYLSGGYCVRVKFLNGKEKKLLNAHLQSFHLLIEDHKKKLKSHMSKLKAIGAL
jgi:hypothetical protein